MICLNRIEVIVNKASSLAAYFKLISRGTTLVIVHSDSLLSLLLSRFRIRIPALSCHWHLELPDYILILQIHCCQRLLVWTLVSMFWDRGCIMIVLFCGQGTIFVSIRWWMDTGGMFKIGLRYQFIRPINRLVMVLLDLAQVSVVHWHFRWSPLFQIIRKLLLDLYLKLIYLLLRSVKLVLTCQDVLVFHRTTCNWILWIKLKISLDRILQR